MRAPAQPLSAGALRSAQWAVLSAFFVLGLAGGSWGARIPDVRDELELAEGTLGTALLGLSVGAVAGAWLGGLLVARVGSRRVISGAWVMVGITLALPPLASSWPMLAVALLVFGVGFGILDVSMNGAGVQLESASERPLLNGLHAGWSGGVLVGAGIGSLAVALDVGAEVSLALVGAVVVVSGLLVRPALPDGKALSDAEAAAQCADAGSAVPELPPPRRGHIARRESEAPGSRRRRIPPLAALAAIGGCVFLAEGAVFDWSGVYVREDLNGAPVLAALAVTGASAGGLLGRLAGDRLTLRHGPVRLVRAGVVVALVGLGLMLAISTPAPVPLLLIAVGAGLAPAVPLAFAAAGRSDGERGIAIVTTAGYATYLGGPGVIGWLAEAIGLRLAFLVPFVLIAAVWILAWSTSGPDRQADASMQRQSRDVVPGR